MKYLKQYSIPILIMFASFLISTLSLTLFSYFDLISDSTLSLLEITIMIIIMFIGGFLIGKKSKNKGWLEGLKIGSIFIIILILLNIIFIQTFDFKNIFYFIILIISSMLGGMIGILKNS